MRATVMYAAGDVRVANVPDPSVVDPGDLVVMPFGGGPAPVRAYIDELPDILGGNIEPGRVLDRTAGLDGVPDGYRTMADRESIKVLVSP